MKFQDYFDRISVIYLPERQDRLRSIRKQVRRLDIEVDWFTGLKFEKAGGFPKASVRGCFMSNYTILSQAVKAPVHNLLLLEEDCVFSHRLIRREAEILQELDHAEWDFVYFGGETRIDGKKVSVDTIPNHFFVPVSSSLNIRMTHFWACRGQAISRLVEFMAETLERPRHHPDGGPMHFDACLNQFRRRNPDIKTLIALPNLGWQLRSASNLSGNLEDKFPFLSTGLKLGRSTKNLFLELADFIRYQIS